MWVSIVVALTTTGYALIMLLVFKLILYLYLLKDINNNITCDMLYYTIEVTFFL